MSPADLAALHAACFTVPRPWTASEFADLLARQDTFLLQEPTGVLLGRALAGEAELLTLAVAPEARRAGIGARLLAGFLAEAAARGAETAFLEVAEDNQPARALYERAGFAPAGRRRAYYRHPDGTSTDALVMTRALDAQA
ncbi:ribosomal protein S18-alanine N-acetyltransferase [Frigidibacter sp.]|uniref:ribosomal protein S18-alanine N-acetyltransferase n=1 Tax=Frigidibacter sp. TaxID=2586418 RepID=UPI0027372548|nr:ribosomal protein S18-alanine N-acetyltransferase [Frigidibacter sp.]MDP3339032.1 ribosomal protein S18-alanine N-acetyltransferase [Frigidibacter sp.]